MKKIYLLGSLNCDLTIRARYLPDAGETLKGSDFMMTAGGKGANQAYAAANLGGIVRMAGAVGKDPFGEMLLSSLKKAGVDTERIRKAEQHSGVAVITVIDGDNRIILDEGANGAVTEADADRLLEGAEAGDLFMTQLENPFPVVLYALKRARERGLFTILNPAPAASEARKAIPYCSLVTPNEKELRLLSGEEDITAGCRALLKEGAGAALVTLGEKGSRYVSAKEDFCVASINVGKAIDTTAAGDTYCGALAVKLSEGAPIREATRFASLAAGITVTRRGAQVSIPTRNEVARYEKS